jgi:hypothetical protein
MMPRCVALYEPVAACSASSFMRIMMSSMVCNPPSATCIMEMASMAFREP